MENNIIGNQNIIQNNLTVQHPPEASRSRIILWDVWLGLLMKYLWGLMT